MRFPVCPSVDAAVTRFRWDGTKKDGKVRQTKHLFQLREQFHRLIVASFSASCETPLRLKPTPPGKECCIGGGCNRPFWGGFPLAPPSLVSFPDKLRASDRASLQISTFVQVFTAMFPILTPQNDWRGKWANINNPSSDYTNYSRVTKAHLSIAPPPPSLLTL